METKETMSIIEAKEGNICKTKILDNFKDGRLECIYNSKKESVNRLVYKVYVGEDIFVLKIINCHKKDEKVIEQAEREYDLGLRAFKMTSGVVKPLDCQLHTSKNHKRIEMLYEYGGENMSGLINKLTAKEALTIMLSALDTLIILHNNGIFHSDIKPINIVVKGNQVKLIDFGSSIDFESKEQLFATRSSIDILIGHTEIYSPPEMFIEVEYVAAKIDVYCWGMSLYQLITKQDKSCLVDMKEMRVSSETYNVFVEMIEQIMIDGEKELSEQVKEILLRALSYDPADRPSFEELKELVTDPKEFYKKELAQAKSIIKKLKEQESIF